MDLIVDLHSHSGHSGGVGNVSLVDLAVAMRRKGIDVYGTGDCLQPAWLDSLRGQLTEKEPGLFALNGQAETDDVRFLLQTEIVIFADAPGGGRKCVHLVLLLPSFVAAERVAKQLAAWEVKLNMGRPILKCRDAADVGEKVLALRRLDEGLEPIPAHVLTPQGVFGSERPVDRLADFFGEAAASLQVFETGLSADPEVLALIPELDGKTLLSCSDGHCAALNRLGREFTNLQVERRDYAAIIRALRAGQVNYTAEFNPAEGRYFLTGHRAGRQGHGPDQFCYYSPDRCPADGLCPICGQELTIGVLQRALELSRRQGDPRQLGQVRPRQASRHLVPLIEVLAAGLGIKSLNSKKLLPIYEKVINLTGSETALWELTPSEQEKLLLPAIPEGAFGAILAIMNGNFTFSPLGFDGEYGGLVLREKNSWFGHAVINM